MRERQPDSSTSEVENEIRDIEEKSLPMDKAIAYPARVEVRWLPGGTMVEMGPQERYEHLNRLAEDPVYMVEKFQEEGTLLGIVDEQFAVVHPTSPHGQHHVTVFKIPNKINAGRVMDNYSGLTPEEQKRFIEINLGIRSELLKKFPDQNFIIGVNRSAPPELKQNENQPHLIVGSQSVQILHSHIVEGHRLGQDQSFVKAYNSALSPEDRLNSRLLSMRTTYITESLQETLEGYLTGHDAIPMIRPVNVVENTGRYVDVQLSEDTDRMLREIRDAIGTAENMFEEMEWGRAYDTLPEPLRDKEIKFGYAWAITPGNHLLIGFTPYRTGYIEFFDIAADRSLRGTPDWVKKAREETKEAVSAYLKRS